MRNYLIYLIFLPLLTLLRAPAVTGRLAVTTTLAFGLVLPGYNPYHFVLLPFTIFLVFFTL